MNQNLMNTALRAWESFPTETDGSLRLESVIASVVPLIQAEERARIVALAQTEVDRYTRAYKATEEKGLFSIASQHYVAAEIACELRDAIASGGQP